MIMEKQKIVMYRGRNFIASFEDSSEASDILQIDQEVIDKACSGEIQFAGDYQWGYERRNKKRKSHPFS